MDAVTIRQLRNEGGRVLERVERGESLTVTRSGRPIAQLVPLPRPPLTTAELKRRMANLPPMDADALRRDIDELFDQSW